jgi:hypothetical protein
MLLGNFTIYINSIYLYIFISCILFWELMVIYIFSKLLKTINTYFI